MMLKPLKCTMHGQHPISGLCVDFTWRGQQHTSQKINKKTEPIGYHTEAPQKTNKSNQVHLHWNALPLSAGSREPFTSQRYSRRRRGGAGMENGDRWWKTHSRETTWPAASCWHAGLKIGLNPFSTESTSERTQPPCNQSATVNALKQRTILILPLLQPEEDLCWTISLVHHAIKTPPAACLWMSYVCIYYVGIVVGDYISPPRFWSIVIWQKAYIFLVLKAAWKVI